MENWKCDIGESHIRKMILCGERPEKKSVKALHDISIVIKSWSFPFCMINMLSLLNAMEISFFSQIFIVLNIEFRILYS